MARKPSKQPKRKEHSIPREDKVLETIADALAKLMTIPGVEGVGEPVTVIIPDDLPPDFMGFIERLAGGYIESNQECLLISIPGQTDQIGNQGTQCVANRIKKAMLVLCQFGLEKGVETKEVKKIIHETEKALG